MEASRFGFGDEVSSGYKFDPTDADIVAFYLLPRALNVANNPYAHAIIDADPASLPPRELLEEHGHGGSDHAFFFFAAAAEGRTKNGGRKDRAVKGGTWRGQKGGEGVLTLLRPGGGGGEADIRYKWYNLTFYRTGEERSTGWVMHEFEIVSPLLPGAVLTRIRATAKLKKEMQAEAKAKALAAADQQLIPYQEQPGPSHQYHGGMTTVTDDGEGFNTDGTEETAGDGEGFNTDCTGEADGYYTTQFCTEEDNNYHHYWQTDLLYGNNGSGAQADFVYVNNGGGTGEAGGFYTTLLGAGDGGGDDNRRYDDCGSDLKYEPDEGQGSGY